VQGRVNGAVAQHGTVPEPAPAQQVGREDTERAEPQDDQVDGNQFRSEDAQEQTVTRNVEVPIARVEPFLGFFSVRNSCVTC